AKRESPPTFLLRRGDYFAKGPEVRPAFPIELSEEEPACQPTERSSGRRTALARWLVDPRNPLTARVIVNRLWQHHFGRGIVGSPSDFGIMGEEPSHPELLDWLATELVARRGSLKAMHRLMVTSATYRQASRPDESAVKADPENLLMARHSRE